MSVGRSSWLVRKLDNSRPWLRGICQARDISDVFSKVGDDDISVYEVDSDLAEARVAAALWVGAGSSAKDPLHLLRIPRTLVAVDVKHTQGSTPIPSVNAWHRDLIGAPDALENLASYLLHRVSCGDAIVRSVHGHGIGCRVLEFLNAGDVITNMRSRVNSRLQQAKTKEWLGEAVECPTSWSNVPQLPGFHGFAQPSPAP